MKFAFFKTLAELVLKEKYKLFLIMLFVCIIFFSVFKKLDQDFFKGRFAVQPGSYYTMTGSLQPEFNLVESNSSLINFLKSYPFFFQMKAEKCKLGEIAIQNGKYIVREQDLYVEVLVKKVSRKEVNNCLKAIEKFILNRHNSLFNNHIKLIKMQIEGLEETYDLESQMLHDLVDSTNDPVLKEKTLRSYSKFDLNLIELEKRKTIAPWSLNLNTFLKTKKNTTILDYRVYDSQVKTFNSIQASIALCFGISLALFLIFIFIRYQKKFNL